METQRLSQLEGPEIGLPVAMHELSRNRRIGILLICSMSLLIVGLDVTIVNVALPSIGRRARRIGLWAAVGGGRVHAGVGEPADAVGFHRRSAGTPADLRDRPRRLLCRFAAVQPGAQPRAARRVPHGAGRRRLDAQPRRDVDHHEHVHRSRGARAGGRRLGGGGRASPWRSGRSSAGLLVSSAGWRSIFWINIPVGRGRHRAGAALHPRVEGTARPASSIPSARR